MAEARAISSKGWSITLLGLACCAAEADVLSEGTLGSEDAGVDLPAEAGVGADAGSYNDAEPEFLGGLARDAGGLIWTSCVLEAIFERARTGDRCDFGRETACSVQQYDECKQDTAACVDGVLHLGSSSKSICTPDDPLNGRRCAAVQPDGCCVDMWQCKADEAAPAGEPVVRVCAPDCDTSQLASAPQWKVPGCPNDPDTPAGPRIWPPPKGMPCEGSFVCDAIGNPAGPDTAFQFGDSGLIYWCYADVILSAAIGNHWPWSEASTL